MNANVRMVPLSIEQVDLVDALIAELMRAGDPRASLLQLIVIQWHALGREPDTFSRRVERDERALTVLRGGAA